MYETTVIEVATLAALIQLKSEISVKDAVAKAIEILEETSKRIRT